MRGSEYCFPSASPPLEARTMGGDSPSSKLVSTMRFRIMPPSSPASASSSSSGSFSASSSSSMSSTW